MNTFILPEDGSSKKYALATYYIELPKEENIIDKAKKMALGQTLGTWVEVPGISAEMQERYMGKVANILEAPPTELSSQLYNSHRTYFVQIAYPTTNFGSDFPMLFTTLLGNDASTSAQVKLVDLQLPESFIAGFKGPKYGIEGIRKLTGSSSGMPLLLNMIKPCTGLTPEEGARIFYDVALGGIDFIKDDERSGFLPCRKTRKSLLKSSKSRV